MLALLKSGGFISTMSYVCNYNTNIQEKKKKNIPWYTQCGPEFLILFRQISQSYSQTFFFQKNQESLEKELCMKDVSTQDVH